MANQFIGFFSGGTRSTPVPNVRYLSVRARKVFMSERSRSIVTLGIDISGEKINSNCRYTRFVSYIGILSLVPEL